MDRLQSLPMNQELSEIYNLLTISPEKAALLASKSLETAIDQSSRDEINWARAYALVELRQYKDALQIWQEIFGRTNNHKSLHQIGYVERSSGNFEAALATFMKERTQIKENDLIAIGANLYELTYCSFLLGKLNDALDFFKIYESLKFTSVDEIERACFFRLKGDLLRSSDIVAAKSAYLQSLNYFNAASDQIGASEIKDRLGSF